MGKKRDWSKIGEIVKKIKDHNLTYQEGADQFGIKVRTIYEYNKRIKKEKRKREQNIVKLEVREEAPIEKLEVADKEEKRQDSDSSPPSHIPEQIEEIILKYRGEHPDHGYKRIEDYLKSQYFIVMPRKKIRGVLKAHGLEKTCDSSFDQTESSSGKGSRRFEADYPRELYQMDVTYVYITGISVLYLAVLVDDNSRFCVAAELRGDQRGGTMIEVLNQAIERYGKPRKLLTDQGSNFYTWSSEPTIFQKYLDDMRIEHLVTDPHSPQTIGKVERFHQTIQRELLHKIRFTSYEEARRAIGDYIHSYNHYRPHQGIEGACPAERFYGVIGESARIGSQLSSKSLDVSKGYMIFKNQDHTISIVGSSKGLQVFMDGILLQQGEKNDTQY
jgi:transposase InsO family protein